MNRPSLSPRDVAERARALAARAGLGTTAGRRSLPILRSADDIRQAWEDPGGRAAVLDGLEGVRDASLELGEESSDRGTTAAVRVELAAPLPNMAAQALAGKAVRRLKALAETGEVPTTDRNPSARDDAGEPAP